MYKICSACKEELSFDNFSNYKNSKDGKKPICKKCVAQSNKNNPQIKYSKIEQEQYRQDNKIITKLCFRCKLEKEIVCFGLSSVAKDGLRGECKKCIKVYTSNNSEKTSKYDKERYQKNKEQITDELKYQRRLEDPEKYSICLPIQNPIAVPFDVSELDPYFIEEIKNSYDGILGSRAMAKKYKVSREIIHKIYKILGIDNSKVKVPNKALDKLKEKNCKDCGITKDISEFRKRDNKRSATGISYEPYCMACEKIRNNDLGKKRAKEKRKSDPGFALHKDISARIWKNIKSNKNNESCLLYLGYSIKELKKHLEDNFEPWMNWENYGLYSCKHWIDNDQLTWKWSLDHITPHSEFKYKTMRDQEFKDCWALKNLRPYSAKQNVLDGVQRTRHLKK